ncbi:hypothetical protein DM02DRAFT_649668 [Periconia macrospinosa]|uniref:SMP-LTD domain-containing protein n=1 Tax=Periconia macrospinosa TaxID=97972 RepID=A0A2V1E841_9PLEO|nr:hypothetical protein DM02DRAFT_649668 [Periconia macrospinosa]
MGHWNTLVIFLGGWIAGALTIPAAALFLWVWGTINVPHPQSAEETNANDELKLQEAKIEKEGLGVGLSENVLNELQERRHVPDVASGYFAVCREFVPGGINGKAPERTNPTGAVTSIESPSVYQSMYRSIFDRNKVQSPSMDGPQGKSKRARNVFYVVLRLGYLMLYDDSEQLEVRHVISLAHHDVEIYAGGQSIPEGELWIKRNCIRLSPRPSLIKNGEAKPFFFFSDNCSEKEDFYHAILQSQEWKAETTPAAPLPQKFDTPDLVKLVQQLHATEENLHTRWINALIGRLFLALYKTQDVDRMIWTKISKKIARVPKPALISGINVQRIDMGHLPPFITNPKLRELTVDGDLTIEADISYKGNFRLDISALARIDLGTRFKAREVTFVLATILRKLEGHILIRIKPPPSNRLWVTFETAPKMVLSLEPIVSSRQITYGVILRAIESRIREVVNETLVLPNWDDIPFTSTESHAYRGGLWEDSKASDPGPNLDINLDGNSEVVDAADAHSMAQDFERSDASSIETTRSAPVPLSLDTLYSRKSRTASFTPTSEDIAISSSTDHRPHAKPMAMRSSSFATVASPIISESSAVPRNEGRPPQDDAATSMKTTISRSPPLEPTFMSIESTDQLETSADSSATIPSPELTAMNTKIHGIESSPEFELSSDRPTVSESESISIGPAIPTPIGEIAPASSPNGNTNINRQSTINSSLVSATAAAKKWISSRQAMNMRSSTEPIGGHSLSKKSLDDPKPTPQTNEEVQSSSVSQSDSKTSIVLPIDGSSRSEPFGRGQPLPPPGTPLPPPPKSERRTWNVPVASAIVNFGRRKPVSTTKPPAAGISSGGSTIEPNSQSPGTPIRPEVSNNKYTKTEKSVSEVDGLSSSPIARKHSGSPPPPPLPRRRQRLSIAEAKIAPVDNELLVVAAPDHEASAPTSPIVTDTFHQHDENKEDVHKAEQRIESPNDTGT